MSVLVSLLLGLTVSGGGGSSSITIAASTFSPATATCREQDENGSASVDFPCTDDVITNQNYSNYVFTLACDAAKHDAESGGHFVCEHDECDSPFFSNATMEFVTTTSGTKEYRYSAVAIATCYCCYDFDPQPTGDARR